MNMLASPDFVHSGTFSDLSINSILKNFINIKEMLIT